MMANLPSNLFGGLLYGGHWTTNQTVHGNSSEAAVYRQTLQAVLAKQQALFAQQAFSSALGIAPEKPKPIENAGIKLGEVIAWRIWKISEGWLKSVTQNFDWPPDQIVEANSVKVPLGCGIHAFKHRSAALGYAGGGAIPVAIGQIALWGEIVEFEHGWHGQYAKVISIDVVTGKRWKKRRLLKKLRKTYGVNEWA